MNAYERAVAQHATWRNRLAHAIGTPLPLNQISVEALRILRRQQHMNALQNRDPDAWMWEVLLGAEIERRSNRVKATA